MPNVVNLRKPGVLAHRLIQDMRFGARILCRNPLFTVGAVLTLALGTGAATAIFSVVNAVILRPLPYPDADRVVAVCESDPAQGWSCYTTSLATYLDWSQQNTSFQEMGVIATGGMAALRGDNGPEQVRTAYVSASLLPMLGVKPVLGRLFVPEEEQRGHADVLIISESLWRSRFGADPSIVNRPVILNGHAFTIVGVAPRDFQLFEPSQVRGWETGIMNANVFRPLVIWPEKLKWRNMREFLALGRLKPLATPATAQKDIGLITARLAEQYPETNRGWGAVVIPWRQEITARFSSSLMMLLCAATFALLVATANVANLLLARCAARQKEFAVRRALGAGVYSIAQQILLESLLLAAIAAVAGVFLAIIALGAFKQFLPPNLPRAGEIGLDGHVLAFVTGVAVLAAIVFGSAPIWQIIRANIGATLKSHSPGGAAPGNFRVALLISQTALVTTLLLGAGLLTRSLIRLNRVDLGFASQNITIADISLGGWRYTNTASMRRFVQELVPRLQSNPAFELAATVNGVPLDRAAQTSDILLNIESHPRAAGEQPNIVTLRQGSPAYFQALNIPVLAGRVFSESDRDDAAHVAVVNETFAHKFYPGELVIGQRISGPDLGAIPCEIIGVVRDVRSGGPAAPPAPEVFLPHFQSAFSQFSIVIRSSQPPASVFAEIQKIVASIDAETPVYNPRTMTQLVDAATAQQKLTSLLVTSVAILALALAMIGIYTALSSIVSARRHEIGIRMALGAQSHSIINLVVTQGMKIVAIGVATGLGAAILLSRWMRSLLFEVSALDPVTLTLIPIALILIALIACWIPARRAARLEPTLALRA